MQNMAVGRARDNLSHEVIVMPTQAYRNALLPLISYPQPTLPAAIACALEAALALDVRLVALDIQVAPPVAAGLAGYSMPVVGTTIDAEEAKTRANAEDIARDFEAQARRKGLSAELRRVTCDAQDAAAVAAATARLFDVTILPLAGGSRADRDLAEGIVFASGRPCLLLPQYWPSPAALAERPLVAWDASRAATRALADALPLLRRAMEVFLVAAAPPDSAAARTLPDVEQWLADHGVRANCARVELAGRTAAVAIDEHARKAHADMLVMGAFGHTRMRDFILGGVTRTVLAEPRLPVLFSH